MKKIIKNTTVEEYAEEINGYVTKTAEMIVRIGDTFNKAKADLQHGEFSKLFDLTPIGQRQAQKYMKIAASEEVQKYLKSEPNSHLGVTKLYQIANAKATLQKEMEAMTDDELFDIGAKAMANGLKWWEERDIYESKPNMPHVDFYKRSQETDLMNELKITYDMVVLYGKSSNIFNGIPDELSRTFIDKLFNSKLEGIKKAMSKGGLPVVHTVTDKPYGDIAIIGLGTHESLIWSLDTAFFCSRDTAKTEAYTIANGMGYDWDKLKWGLSWIDEKLVSDIVS